MGPVKLTKKTVDALEPGPARVVVRDSAIPGFALRVEPSGVKTYLLRYRVGGRAGSAHWVTLGRHGVITAEEARTMAEKLRGDVAKGLGPEKATKGKGKTFKDAATKFMAEHAEVHLKPATVTDYKALLRLHVHPHLAKLGIGACDLEVVKVMHLAIGKGQERTANKSLALVSAILTKAEEWEWRSPQSNPCALVTKFKDVERSRYLTPEEIALLLAALNAYQQVHPIACDIIRLMLFTGRRYSEIQSLRWSELDEARGLITRETKTGPKVFAVDDESLKILARQKRGGEWVFTGLKGNASVAAVQLWQKKLRTALGFKDVKLHDLRHTLASHALDSGMDAKLVGGLLGHSDRRSTDRYTHIFAAKLREKANAAQQSVAKAGKAGKKKALTKLVKG